MGLYPGAAVLAHHADEDPWNGPRATHLREVFHAGSAPEPCTLHARVVASFRD